MTSEELRARLHESRARLFVAIQGLTEEQFRHTPAVEEWNIAAHLSHLLRIERVFADRGAAALREDEPFCASTRVANEDDPALAQRLAVPQIIHGMQAARRGTEALLDAGDVALERAIIHERFGRMSVDAIVQKMADHELEHTEAIAALARQASRARGVTIPLTPRS